MEKRTPQTFAVLLKKLILTPSEFSINDLSEAIHGLAEVRPPAVHPAQIGSFLTGLYVAGRDKEPEVVAECAKILREYSIPIALSDDNSEEVVCDIVGTGGDGHDTFNVSTSAGIIAAASGLKVFKHGNKASTSSSGSADILMALECPVTEIPPSALAQISSESSFLFLFAPLYHPSLAPLAPIRKSLPFPTIFNILGPLLNPCRPSAVIIGVYCVLLGDVFIQALRVLGVKRAWVVCGDEGLDEISPAGTTHVWDLENDKITRKEVTPASFGLASHPLSSVRGGDALQNASTLITLLNGKVAETDPIENYVMMNTAALLFVAGKVSNLIDGVKLARELVNSGKAAQVLETFRMVSQKAVLESQK